MQRKFGPVAVLAGVVAQAALCVWSSVAAQPQPTLRSSIAGRADEFVPRIDPNLRFQGAASCAASACHGGQEPDARPNYIRRNEYSIWSDRDAHSRAHETLANPRSRQILTRLGIRTGDSKYQNCENCHSPKQWSVASTATALPHASQQEGVACEVCHGAAERWRTKHFLSDWNPSQAERFGMIDTDNPLTRARLCADCHVGSPNREVNHELLAAGHPPLRFDYAALMQRMPKHWNERGDQPQAVPATRDALAAGHVAAADAALELLAARTAGTDRQRLWPELATARCVSCHHPLTATQSAVDTRPSLAANVPRFEDEFFAWIERNTADARQSSIASQLHATLVSLRQTMNGHAVPDAATVHRLATTARGQLQAWIAEKAK